MSTRTATTRTIDVAALRRPTEPLSRRRTPPPPPRPDLKLVKGGESSRLETLSPRRRLVGIFAIVGLVLFAVVAFHVLLSQGQFKLEGMQTKAEQQQGQYERLRLQVAQLESPERITSEATGRLGMVVPKRVTTVTPSVGDMPKNTPATPMQKPGNNSSDYSSWSSVKSHLDFAAK